MDAARLPPKRVPEASAAVAIHNGGRWPFVGLLGLTSFFAFQVAAGAIASAPFLGLVVNGGMAFVFALVASRCCSRVELHQNGKLVVHYFVRPTVTVWIEEVSEINRGAHGECSVYFNRSTFYMSRNDSATSLVRALMRNKPTIALTGEVSTLPEL